MFFNNKEVDKVISLLDTLEQFVKGETNRLVFDEDINIKKLKKIADKVVSLGHFIQEEKTQDMRVFGEIMIVCEKLSDGFTDDEVLEVSTDQKINYIAKTINQTVHRIDDSLKRVTKILHEYENDNFINSVEEDIFRGGELQNLLKGLNTLQQGITKRVSQGYRFGLALEHESKTLNQEAQRLSVSSAKQAEAIEQTLNNIKSISQNIKENTETANEMSENSTLLKESSLKSESSLSITTESMDKIDIATQAVYDAISVISQISFQTNILSLNAAVEAATAGEAGKGFAVVAQEVRNLASRSAEAAKTIEDLMDQLKAQTTQGKQSSHTMQEEYQRLSENINQTLSLIDNILQSSKEQEINIVQINESIDMIDNETKLNVEASEKVKHIAKESYEMAEHLVNVNQNVQFIGKEKIRVKG